MSDEKGFDTILYETVKDTDPALHEVISDALSPYLDVELVINIVASYSTTTRRTYLSCAMKPSSSNDAETKQDDSDNDDEAGNRGRAPKRFLSKAVQYIPSLVRTRG